ncbi:MAG: MaoC family dehydratase [Elusimicrobiota bacterium]|jgi:acyl dehydratase
MADPLYLEDFPAGTRFTSGLRKVTAENIIAFAREFDPQPFHVDPAAAEKSVFQGLAASGWHTASLTMRLFVDSVLIRTQGAVGLGIDRLRWHRPVRPGDVLSSEVEILDSRPSSSQAGKGVVRFRVKTMNGTGEPVLSLEGAMLVPRRP